ncbi:MAG: quaternary ammonium compound-resistance protein SugE [Nitrospinota bacterium]|nr:MAG: quaternary ammonium compound-resistance protein SugE [Nitrospinota bacterium]
MAWISLLIAGLFEVGWAIGLKYTENFSRFWPSIGTILAMLLSLYFLSVALQTIPVGTAYAVWTGIGAAGTALLGILLFGESRDLLRIGCILLIVTGVVGLKVLSGENLAP